MCRNARQEKVSTKSLSKGNGRTGALVKEEVGFDCV